jgi:drug/metabolite transporter, DME family
VTAEPPDSHTRSASFGRRCILTAAVLWSLSGVMTKALGGLDGTTIAFYRGLFAGLVLLPLVPRSRWEFQPAMIPLAIIFGGMTGLYITSITQTTAANAIFLQYSAAVWTIPASLLLLKERPTRRDLLGSAIAAIGITIIVAMNQGSGGPNDRLGILLGLGSGLCYGLVAVMMRFLRAVHPMWMSIVNNLGGSLVIGLWILATKESFPVPSFTQMLSLAIFGVVQMAIPYALFARGLQDVRAPEAGLLSLIEPILNPIWVFLVVREKPEWSTWVGGAFLLAGVGARYFPMRRVKRQP